MNRAHQHLRSQLRSARRGARLFWTSACLAALVSGCGDSGPIETNEGDQLVSSQALRRQAASAASGSVLLPGGPVQLVTDTASLICGPRKTRSGPLHIAPPISFFKFAAQEPINSVVCDALKTALLPVLNQEVSAEVSWFSDATAEAKDTCRKDGSDRSRMTLKAVICGHAIGYDGTSSTKTSVRYCGYCDPKTNDLHCSDELDGSAYAHFFRSEKVEQSLRYGQEYKFKPSELYDIVVHFVKWPWLQSAFPKKRRDELDRYLEFKGQWAVGGLYRFEEKTHIRGDYQGCAGDGINCVAKTSDFGPTFSAGGKGTIAAGGRSTWAKIKVSAEVTGSGSIGGQRRASSGETHTGECGNQECWGGYGQAAVTARFAVSGAAKVRGLVEYESGGAYNYVCKAAIDVNYCPQISRLTHLPSGWKCKLNSQAYGG